MITVSAGSTNFPKSTQPKPLHESILPLLQSSADESKVAGLMLIPRAVSCSDEESLLRIYHAVGFSFLLRLMSSPGSPGDPSDDACIYKVLALNILSTFCVVPAVRTELIGEGTFHTIASELLSCLRTKVVETSLDDAVTVLKAIADTSLGRKELNKMGAPSLLLQMMCDDFTTWNENKSSKIFDAYDAIIDLDEYPVAAADSVSTMVQIFNSSKTMVKFEAFARLVGILSSTNQDIQTLLRISAHNEWSFLLRDALMELLQNRLPSSHRIQVCSTATFVA